MSPFARLRRAWWGIRQECRWGWRHVKEGRRSYLLNVLLYRVLALWPAIPGAGRESKLTTDVGITLTYRCDRGDLQGIREIFIDEIYRLPVGAAPRSLVDLGANIGLATVWLCHHYAVTTVTAYEPLSENATLFARNCEANGIEYRIICAAVGVASDTVSFEVVRGSNMGRVGEGSRQVHLVGINEMMAGLSTPPDLLKMDIEGMERDLVTLADPAWMTNFSLIVLEMHPQYYDIVPVIEVIKKLGYVYFPPVEVTRGTSRSKRERLFVKEPTSLAR